ncbi:hypothetical protein ACOME3_008079 [Neoechinorhynchus agilis]
MSIDIDVIADKSSYKWRFLLCFLGIFVSYLLFGIAQESVMKTKFGDQNFIYVTSLVLIQSLVNFTVASIFLRLRRERTSRMDSIPKLYFSSSAFSFMAAMVCSNSALSYVSYPTQVIGKSVKPISVMVLGVLFARKRYPLRRYICIFTIVIGVTMFMYDKNRTHKTSETHLVGYLLIGLSLFFDGMTGAIQDMMRSKIKIDAFELMSHMNAWSVIWSSLGVIFFGEISGFVIFMSKHPRIILNLLLLCASGSSGQIFIFFTVQWFGPLVCSVFTTTRKFFTILFSVILFGNTLSVQQWIGATLVFSGLLADNLSKKK